MTYWTVSLSRRKSYTEEGTVCVEAATPEAARLLALAMAERDEVEFQADAGGTEVSNTEVVSSVPAS
jgi:hypothetical protein